MELKLKQITLPEAIEFNFDELKQEVEERTAAYVDVIYTDDQMTDAKKDLAALRKFTKALSSERIRVKKEFMKPYEDFESKIKELTGIVDKAITSIDSQVKSFNEQKRNEKLSKVLDLWEEALAADKVPEAIKFDQIFDEKWLNASVRLSTVKKDIDQKLKGIAEAMQMLQNLPEFGFEALQVYKNTLDVKKAVEEAQRMSEIQKEKAEHEAKEKAKQEEQQKLVAADPEEIPGQASFTDVESFNNYAEQIKTEEQQKEWISFQALMSVEDALALKAFFKSRNIEFKAV